MFKLESYITPVILSYVEKYVKNFKPEQSQVSLWGGDASFQNLDLRLEVLEEQLNLPFSFVSGHIHELLIHVPWVKITSEPIIVTINTIECILKLKSENKAETNAFISQSNRETEQEEAPPGYIKSIVTKVINNITIHCNNLILKYVEEDIVLSINVRFLSMQTVNHKWEPAFTDITGYEVMVRKIINIQDLTLCLDKMDASGKIEIYQDPVLYRCSMTIRLIINYHGSTARRASITRMDLHCQKMEFSITEQQVPMLCRLIALLLALQTKQFPAKKERNANPIEEREDYNIDDNIQSIATKETASWSGWAWNMVSSVLPTDWESELSNEQQIAYSGHTVHLGVYIDDATITFKIIESVKEQVFYKSRKLRYKSFSSLQLNGVVIDSLLQGIAMTSFQVGIGYIRLYPRGNCSCGHPEVVDGIQPPLYLIAGKMNIDYLKDSLFDNDAVENKGKKRDYKQNVDYHLATYTVEKLLERCPALIMDYVHCASIPDDITPDQLVELGTNFEESNLKEQRFIRYIVGDFTIRICSGILHRFDTIKLAAEKYDYDPYFIPKSDPNLDELPPVTLEEYESLRENVSMVETKFIIVKTCVQLQLADHCNSGLPRQRKIIENRAAPLNPTLTDDPFISFECDEAVISIMEPIYQFKLASCASRQTDLSTEMFDQCHRCIKIQLNGGKSQLHLTNNCHTSLIMPCSAECSFKELLYPQYWQNVDLIQKNYYVKVDGITITGTKAQLIVATSIINSLFNPTNSKNLLICSSLFNDACRENNPTYLELSLENINYSCLLSLATVCMEMNIDSIKIFALNNTQQAFILSGPENEIENIDKPLITAILQFPKDTGVQTHPSLISFQVAEIRGSLDPLLFHWLDYHVTYNKLDSLILIRNETQPIEGTLSDKTTRKKTFPSLHESVHSTSDKERKKSVSATKKSKTIKNDDFHLKAPKSEESDNSHKSQILTKLSNLYQFWSMLILNGCIGHIVIYIPSNSMSGINAYGIEQAKDSALEKDPTLQILVLTMPSLLVHSSNMNTELLLPYLQKLPVKLPKSIWVQQTQSFPWTLSLFEFHCYTLKKEEQKSFIKEVSLNTTLALTTKIATSEVTGNSLTALGLCVHIDNSPIIISVSEDQMIFMSNILINLIHIFRRESILDENKVSSSTREETQVLLPIVPQTPSTPPQLLYPENTTTTSTVSTSKEEYNQDKEGVFLTAWIQWTITKVAVKLYVMGQENQPSLKLVLELEDIITSLDLQPVYLKLKNKITTSTIFHYVKAPHSQTWDFGEYVGLVLCGREDTLQKGEDLGFLSITLTRAKSGNVHTRWGAFKRHKNQKKESITETTFATNSYISEVVIKVQMVDVILPLSVLNKYMQLMMPLTRLNKSVGRVRNNDTSPSFPLNLITNLNNESLPLIYLEFKGLRLMIPASTTARHKLQHDLLMFQLEGIFITPHAENPICRTPLRQDIYQLAAQANILSVPGSAVEDRQYQINVKGICMYTTTWKNYQLSINKRISQSYLYTMNENPALEWNKLGNGNNLEPHFSTYPVLTRFDICLIIAPTITFKPDTIVCGSAMEVNCLTDIDITINLDQLKLISKLHGDIKSIISGNSEEMEITDVTNSTTQKFTNAVEAKMISIERNLDDEMDYTKDSGIDFEMSSINSTTVGKSLHQEKSMLPPFEFLVNCGKMTLILYDAQKNLMNCEYLIGTNEIDEDNNTNLKQPLFYIMINQPNIYLLQQYSTQKIQISCFDITIALGDKDIQDLTSLPTEKDFKIFMIETKSGEPPVDTGIPPSFMTIKCEKSPGKNSQFYIDMGRPTKFYISLSRLRQIENINNKVMTCFVDEDIVKVITESPVKNKPPVSSTIFNKLKVPDFNLNTKQIVLSLKTDFESEIMISLASLSGSTSTLVRPDRIYSNMSLDSFIISAILENNIKVLLNPWCCNLTIYFLWESWQESDAFPQIQLQADSESIYLDFSPDQIKILKTVIQDCQILFNELCSSPLNDEINEKQIMLSTEQHYKDDLKAGAFQFTDGNAEELPFPYQAVFFNYPQQAMAWRYPQPRTLTRIHVCPVPFENASNSTEYIKRIPCAVEYWSDCHMAYQRYVDFYLSETESYRLELPDKAPARAVACIWRVVLLPQNRSSAKTLISSRALAACLRIDSYFNSTIIPNIQAALNIGIIHVSLYNHVNTEVYNNLTGPLNNYILRDSVPEMQCFIALEQKGAVFVFNKWLDKSVLIDVSGVMSIQVLDYGHLTMQEVLEPLDGKFQFSLTDKTDMLLICKSFTLKVSPSIAHTLAVSAHLWSTSLNDEENKSIVLTRYVVANNSDMPIRFGQSGTDDNILLDSRECHFYSWRQIGHQMLRIAIEINAWIWSRPFPVNQDGTQVIEFINGPADVILFANITPLSATQKLVTFSGQLIISNQLNDNFEMRLVKYESDIGSKVTVLKNIYKISGKSEPLSFILENDKKMAIRLRFSNVPNLSWTGDIPLQPNIKWGQPWLVKVPLQERGQFLSIWVRIITQIIQGKLKILAVLSPLYKVRSHLPVPVTVHIETPSLKTSLSTVINGRGECQQLYCPGTFEHFHQLTFQLESGVSASNPYVPLSYSSVDQRKFFRRPENENIDAIIKELENQKDEPKWPFQSDDIDEWIPAEQPQTHVQVKYQDAKLVSSTLLLELQPWCFILNSMGCHLSLVSEDTELCQVPHYGIVTPPKLEGTFHFGIAIGDTYYISQTLQLARPDWSQSFYMPRIDGLIPVEGSIKASVDCGSSISFLSISSNMHEDMRLVRVNSSHVISNSTSQELYVATLAVHDSTINLNLPDDLTPFSLNILPSDNHKQATPIVQWHMLNSDTVVEPVALYISLSLGYSWSCPVKVDQNMSRRCISIPTDNTTLPIIITTQEDKGTIYIIVHKDDHPQLQIENTCSFKIVVGQSNETTDGILLDAPHFSWMCKIESGATCHYSLPLFGSRLPDSPTIENSNTLLLAILPTNNKDIERKDLRWSRGINLSVLTSTPIEQFVRLPLYGDVKLLIQNRCYTIHINIVPMSQVEVSARDIRSRLLRKESKKELEMIYNKPLLELPEEEKVIVAHSSSSSTSITSFYSAQEDESKTESSSLGRLNVKLTPKVRTSKSGILEETKSKDEVKRMGHEGSAIFYFHGVTIVIMHDVNENSQRIEVASLSMTDLVAIIDAKANLLSLCICIGDLQLDNQMFDQGGFDFPVVLISQNSSSTKEKVHYANNSLINNIAQIKENSLIVIDYTCEFYERKTAYKDFHLRIAPISAYIEDTYISSLLDYVTSMVPPCLLVPSDPVRKIPIPTAVYVPDYIIIDTKILSTPLRVQRFIIDPLSILLSVHTSVHLYVALDHSPLYFGVFEKKNLLTTPYRLGNALTMHYLSGAIFGAGWVVGSLEILGSPGGLAQALGSGLRDFVSLPFQGLLQGPWGFIVGITHGSASLMKHVTAGTVNSVTKLASSVARNLDRLTLDEEHLQRQEESRRVRPQGMAQGLYQGLTGFGMSLLAAVAGLAHHPLQQVWSGGTTKGLVTGVGLGLVGVVTKPLSGAAELVALTGQGLLQGAGWNSLPSPRQRPVVQYTSSSNNASVRYAWRLLPLLENRHDNILHVANADYVIHQGSNRPVTLVLTRQALLLVNMAEDSVEKIFSLKELNSIDHSSESNMLCLYCPRETNQSNRPLSPEREMDQEMRARVAEYVRTSSTGLASISTNSDGEPDAFDTNAQPPEHAFTFYVGSDSRNYLLSLFNIAKRQNEGIGFTVL